MKIFKCDTSIKNCRYPIAKIVLSCLLIALLVMRGCFFSISSGFWELATGILCAIIVVLSVLCIYISFAEMLLLYERREKKHFGKAISQSRVFSVSYILSLLEVNDIVEILLACDNRIITVMASSDNRQGSAKFFDKCYHIGDSTFTEFVDFKEAIIPYAIGGEFCIIEIDGVPANRYFSTGDGLSEH